MTVVRRYREDDAPAIAALTLAAIRQTALAAYSSEQVAAWSARFVPERVTAWATRGDIILVAVDAADCAIAYTTLKTDAHLDMLYCDPAHTGRGLAGHLLAEAEQVARGLGLTRIFTEASELARPVFERAGYAVTARRDFTIPFEGRAVPIHNYAMEKQLR